MALIVWAAGQAPTDTSGSGQSSPQPSYTGGDKTPAVQTPEIPAGEILVADGSGTGTTG